MLDNYNDSISPSAVYLGTAGIAGLTATSLFAKRYEQDLYDSSETVQRAYKFFGGSNPADRPRSTFLNRLSGSKESRIPFREDAKMFKLWGKDRVRDINSFEQGYFKTIGRSKNIPTKMWKPPLAYGFGLMTMKMEMDESSHFSGAARGIFSEGAGLAGARIGGAIGGFAGPIGTVAGTLIGGAIGYSTLGIIEGAASMGRSWSTPELGGNYVDSAEAMTLRQRSLNSIRTSQFNVRNELGREATRLVIG